MTTEDESETNPKTGRPRVEIGIEALTQLASINATQEEAAAFFKCTRRTMIRRLKDPVLRQAWEDGRGLGKLALRRLQWRHAKGTGSSAVTMTIHLSKHMLGETEKSALEVNARVDANVQVTTSAHDRLTSKLDELSDRIARRAAGLLTEGGAGQVPVRAE